MYNVQVIINENFPLDCPLNALGMTALHFACCAQNADAIALLLQANSPLYQGDNVRIINKSNRPKLSLEEYHCTLRQQTATSKQFKSSPNNLVLTSTRNLM